MADAKHFQKMPLVMDVVKVEVFIIIKRLEDALKNNDRIYAEILAINSNQDGKSNGITAPSEKAQLKLIKKDSSGCRGFRKRYRSF